MLTFKWVLCSIWKRLCWKYVVCKITQYCIWQIYFVHNLRVLYVEVGFCGAESKLAKSDNQADSGSHRNKNNLNLDLVKSGRQDKWIVGFPRNLTLFRIISSKWVCSTQVSWGKKYTICSLFNLFLALLVHFLFTLFNAQTPFLVLVGEISPHFLSSPLPRNKNPRIQRFVLHWQGASTLKVPGSWQCHWHFFASRQLIYGIYCDFRHSQLHIFHHDGTGYQWD